MSRYVKLSGRVRYGSSHNDGWRNLEARCWSDRNLNHVSVVALRIVDAGWAWPTSLLVGSGRDRLRSWS